MGLIYFPKRGYHKGQAASQQPPDTSSDLNNVRPLAGGRFQGGQRPGLEKTHSEQIGGETGPVVWVGSVAVID